MIGVNFNDSVGDSIVDSISTPWILLGFMRNLDGLLVKVCLRSHRGQNKSSISPVTEISAVGCSASGW